MRRLLLALNFMLALAAFREVAALPSFSNPLANMSVSQSFGGSGGTHIATDFDGTAGDPIYAIADGNVCYYSGSAGGYGGGSSGCARDGAVLFVRHRKSNGDYFIAQYGHIQNVPIAYQQITQYTTDGPSILQGQKIAEIGEYWPKRNCSPGRDDHLHFGIWNSNEPIPPNHWGYTTTPYSYCWTTPVNGCWIDPVPFLTDENPYSFPYSSQFNDVFNRNGGSSTMGSAISGIYAYGPYLRQDYDGGSYNDCCILFDPNNGLDNPQATNEAYLLRTGFYNYYFANGEWEAFGCPSRDEYHPETGASGDAIQFFVKRPSGGPTEFHYMYFEANLPTNQPPPEVISWHSSYTCDYVDQNPSGAIYMVQGESRTFTVRFRNTGTTTWYNNATSHPYDYICLKSTDPSGNIATSLLNSPYEDSLGWIDSQAPCTMNESSVSPGNTATFTFTGKVASSRQPGQMIVYFRPCHSMAGMLPGWDGMNYDIRVLAQDPDDNPWLTDWGATDGRYVTLAGYFDSDTKGDLMQYDPTVAGYYVAISTGTSFNALGPWLSGWGATDGRYVTLAQDYTGDGKWDLMQYDPTVAGYYVAKSLGTSFQALGPWLSGWGATDGRYTTLTGDFTGDGKGDLMQWDPTVAGFYVAKSTGSSFQALGAWLSGWGNIGVPHIHRAGDFTGDGKDDLVQYNPTYATYYVAKSTGSAFTPVGGCWLANWGATDGRYQFLAGDFTGDGKTDLLQFDSTVVGYYVAKSTGTAFQALGPWLSGWGVANRHYVLLVADYNNDGFDDICRYDPATADYYVALSTGSAFVASGYPKRSIEPDTPSQFSLSHNYPNPFNPSTTISYSLPQSSHVRIDIYNILGQNITTLIDEQQETGEHQVIWNAGDQSTGMYFYRIVTDDNSETKKMLLLK